MATQPPDWQLFRSFLTVMREGSLSRAARTLGISQPTMGRHIAALETALGIKLFSRSRDGLIPTDAGLRLSPAVEAMAAAAASAERVVSGQAEEESGTVRLTASVVVGSEVLPPILVAVRKLVPHINIELVLSNRNQDLIRGDADIAIRMVRPTQGSLVAKRAGRIDVGLYAHRLYMRRRQLPRRIEDLARHALIGYDRELGYGQLLEKFGLPFASDRFAFRSDSEIAQLAALRAGYGIGPCQVGIARRDKDLIPILHSVFVYPMDVWLVMHRDSRTNRRIRLMFDQLVPRISAYAETSRSESTDGRIRTS